MSVTKEKKENRLAQSNLFHQNLNDIKRIVEANKELKLNEIADILNKWGFKTKRGYNWTTEIVSRFMIQELDTRRNKTFTKQPIKSINQEVIEVPETDILPNYEIKDLVFEKEGKFFTDSLMIASTFEKPHDAVLKIIRNLECSNEFRLVNFYESSYVNLQNKVFPKYNLTRDGFSMIAMGFTGSKAIQFKEIYINKFNEMEDALKVNWREPKPKELSAREVMALTLQSLDEQDIKLFNQIKQESDSIKFETHQALEIQKQELDKKIKELDKKVSDIQNIQPSNLPLFNIESKGFLKTKETFKGNIPFQKEKNVITDLVMEYKTLRNINDGTAWNALYDTYRQNTNPPIDLKEERDLYNQGKKGAQIIPSTILYAQQFGYCPQLLATINKMVFNLKEVLK